VGAAVVAAGTVVAAVVAGVAVVALLAVVAAVVAGAPSPPPLLPQAASAATSVAGITTVRANVLMLGHATQQPATMPGGPWPQETEEPHIVRTQVEETIEAIRPALQADGGDIFLKDVDEDTGVITVSLVGACGTCPASTQTLKAGI